MIPRVNESEYAMAKKTITFFNEKGGTGKTTFAALFASWLRYNQGEEVVVYDYDFPSFHLGKFREVDNYYYKENGGLFQKMCDEAGEPYPIVTVGSSGVFEREQLREMVSGLKAEKGSGSGYIVLDFPGSFKSKDPIFHYLANGLIDLIVLPINSDSQSRLSALNVFRMMRHPDIMKLSGKDAGQECLFLWNGVTQTEAKAKDDRYDNYGRSLQQIGGKICRTRVKDIPILRRDPENPLVFIRSTRCYPIMNIRRYCPYLNDLFEEIKNELDSSNE